MDKARAHVLINGRVQGVFYRAFTRELASALGLNGWVEISVTVGLRHSLRVIKGPLSRRFSSVIPGRRVQELQILTLHGKHIQAERTDFLYGINRSIHEMKSERDGC